MGKKVIRLTEADIEKIVKKIISEQGMNDTEVLNELNKKIQSFMKEKQKEIFNENLFIQPVAGPNGNPNIEITDKEGNVTFNKPFLYYQDKGNLVIVKRPFDLGSVELKNYYDEIIGNNSNFKKLISLHPEIKDQMDNMKISLLMGPLKNIDGIPSFKLFQYDKSNASRKGKKSINARRKKLKSNDKFWGFNTKIPLMDFFNGHPMAWGRNRFFIEIEMGSIGLYLDEVGLVNFGDEGETVTPEFASENIKLDLVDVFKFDTIDMNDPSGYQEVLVKFKSDLNDGLTGLKGFKEFLQKQNLVVNGFASRDNDPNEKVQGKFSGCRGYGDGTRGQYNLCLSEERAKKVAEDLQEIFNSFGINVTIKSKGHGETSKFGPAWSKEKPTKPKDTQPNRRITFNIPKYTETIRN